MRTGHSAQIRLASRDEPPFSGKKTSGSYSRHRARSCHGMKWCTAPPPNYILVILNEKHSAWQVRAESFFGSVHRVHSPPHTQIVACRRPMRKDLGPKSFRSG